MQSKDSVASSVGGRPAGPARCAAACGAAAGRGMIRRVGEPPAPRPAGPPPAPVVYVRELLAGFGATWFLCGGWAVDAWLGRQTRDHDDVDIAVFRDDERAIFDHLAGWHLIAHDTPDADHTDPWDGRPLKFPAHIHTHFHARFDLEFHLNERSGRDWIFSREPRVAMPLRRSIRRSAWGMPTAVPEVVVFYKAVAYKDLRPRDEHDFLALLPHLTEKERRWLWEAVSLVHPGHRWLTQLSP
jgi:aminoglycoside-2''-adenylyltransferase